MLEKAGVTAVQLPPPAVGRIRGRGRRQERASLPMRVLLSPCKLEARGGCWRGGVEWPLDDAFDLMTPWLRIRRKLRRTGFCHVDRASWIDAMLPSRRPRRGIVSAAGSAEPVSEVLPNR